MAGRRKRAFRARAMVYSLRVRPTLAPRGPSDDGPFRSRQAPPSSIARAGPPASGRPPPPRGFVVKKPRCRAFLSNNTSTDWPLFSGPLGAEAPACSRCSLLASRPVQTVCADRPRDQTLLVRGHSGHPAGIGPRFRLDHPGHLNDPNRSGHSGHSARSARPEHSARPRAARCGAYHDGTTFSPPVDRMVLPRRKLSLESIQSGW
jgi:hypothetical protein